MKKLIPLMAALFFAQLGYADTVSVCFSQSSTKLAGHSRVIVTESDGGFVDVQSPNHTSPEVMLRGTYPDTAPDHTKPEELGLEGWAELQNPKDVTGLSIEYTYFGANNQWANLSKLTIREAGKTIVYGACKVLSSQ